MNGPAHCDLKFSRGVEVEDAYAGSGVEEKVEGVGALGSVNFKPNHSFAVIECELIGDLWRRGESRQPKGREQKCQKGLEPHNRTIAVTVPCGREKK